MAEDKEPSARRGAAFMAAFVAQWQVLLTLAVGAVGLLYNFNEQRRVELSLNRDAVTAARADAERFRADPQNTLAEYQATYPEHAFCASLGFFVAEGGRAQPRGAEPEPGRPGAAFVDVSDALLGKVEAQATAIGLEPEDFRGAWRPRSPGPRRGTARPPAPAWRRSASPRSARWCGWNAAWWSAPTCSIAATSSARRGSARRR